MSASIIAPEFEINIFQPNTERPLKFPVEYISSITSTRGLRGNSMTINFARSGREGGEPYRYFFTDQSFVQLLVKKTKSSEFRQENLCYVSAVSSQGLPNKRMESITISGLETKLRNQELFIDIQQGQEETIDEIKADVSAGSGNSFANTLSSLGDVFKNVRRLPDLFKAVYDNYIANLANPHSNFLFGGKQLFKTSKTSQNDPFLIIPYTMDDGYTTTFIHVLNLMTGYTIGTNANFWDVITSLECEPLYEMFFDALESESNDQTQMSNLSKYEVENGKVSLVFRKTPFDFFMDTQGNWDRKIIDKYLPENKIKSINCSFSQDNVYTGVHVGISNLGQTTSTLIQPPRWNPNLKAHFGYKLLRIMLDGVSFEKKPTIGQIKSSYKKNLTDIQNKIFDIFCNFPAVKAGLVDIETQYDYFRPGTALLFDNPEIDFGDIGYIESVTSTFQARGHASSSISLKWVDYELKTEFSKKVQPVSGYSKDELNQTQTV